MATVTSVLAYKPLALQAVTGDDPVALGLTYSAETLRNLVGAVWPRAGVIGATGFRLYQRQAGANWSIDVSPGFAVVGDTVNEFDRYLCFLPARLNLSVVGFNTAPTATRTHRVFLAVYDKQVLGTEYAAKVVVTEDTGAGAPLPADNPAYTLELGRFTIAPGQSSVQAANITNIAVHAATSFSARDLPLQSTTISGEAASGGGPPRYHVTGSRVVLSGTVARSTGNFLYSVMTSTPYLLGVLPPEYCPSVTRNMASTGAAGYPVRISVSSTGNITANWKDNTDLVYISLDGCSFELD